MRNTLVAGLATGAALLSAGSAGATTITFEELNYTYANYYPSPDRRGYDYYQYGVTIGPTTGTYISGSLSPNGTQGVYGSSSDGRSSSPLRAGFPQPTDYVSIDLGDFGVDAEQIYLRAYDRLGTLLGESTLDISDTDMSMHTLSVSASGINYVEFGSSDRRFFGGSIYADNLTFNAGTVPEPATWAMMLAGLGAIGATMRHRRVTVNFG